MGLNNSEWLFNTMKQPVISEKEITHSIRSYLKAFGIFHWKNFGTLGAAVGVADILGIYQGKFLAIEVKTERGKLSPAQERFIANINDKGGIAFVARCIDDVENNLHLKMNWKGK